MKITIDASRATKPIRRGPEQYSYHLILALAKIDKKNQYILYSPLPPKDELVNLPKNFSWRIIPFRRFWTQMRLSFEMLKNSPPLLFVPSHIIPFIHPQKVVLTVHDLGYKYQPELYTPFARFYENFSLKYLVKSATRIITPSLATKNDLLRFVNLNPDKIRIVYHGYNQKLYYPQKIKKQKFPYLYFLGGLEEKKNVVGLIEAFKLLKLSESRFAEYKLVLGGKPGHRYEKIRETIEKLPSEIKNDVLELGYISDEEAAFWMRNADVFILPSFFEGFGIPVIEAMASAVPVVISNTPALSEIANNAALSVNPTEPDDIASAIKKIIFDKKLKEDLVQRGLKRAAVFSWEKCAEETLKILEEAWKD